MTADLPITGMVAFLLALVRTASWMVVSPPFNNRLIPRYVKLGTAAAISLAITPSLNPAQLTLETGPLLGMVLMQIATGLVLGFLTMILFSAVQAAGSMIDLFGGFTLTQGFDPMMNNQSSVFGRLYSLLGITLLFVINGHLMLIKGFMTTLDVIPLTGIGLDGLKTLIFRDISIFLLAAVEIAGPLLAAYFLTEIAIGLISKAAPQLNVIMFGLPLKILLTLLLISLALPALPNALETLNNQSIRHGLDLLRFAKGG